MLEALVLLLAQTCVAEIGLQPDPAECVVMWEVNARTAGRRKISIQKQTRAFNSYWKIEHKARAWVEQLTLVGDEPALWPSDAGWERLAPRWLAVVARARRFVDEYPRGAHKAVCAGADTYGGTPGDGVGADDAAPCGGRALRITCLPGELQAYWHTGGCRSHVRPVYQ